MLDEKQLRALEKLDRLANYELKKIRQTEGIFHEPNFQQLSHVAGWVAHVKKYHANPYAKSEVEGCIQNLREVAKKFKFDLREEE